MHSASRAGAAFALPFPPLPAKLLANMTTKGRGDGVGDVWPGCKLGGVQELVELGGERALECLMDDEVYAHFVAARQDAVTWERNLNWLRRDPAADSEVQAKVRYLLYTAVEANIMPKQLKELVMPPALAIKAGVPAAGLRPWPASSGSNVSSTDQLSIEEAPQREKHLAMILNTDASHGPSSARQAAPASLNAARGKRSNGDVLLIFLFPCPQARPRMPLLFPSKTSGYFASSDKLFARSAAAEEQRECEAEKCDGQGLMRLSRAKLENGRVSTVWAREKSRLWRGLRRRS